MRPQSSRQALQLMIKLFVIGLLPITLLANAIAHTPVPQIITDFIGFLTMMTVATTAYLGICYITLHQRELRNEQRPQAPSGIDFGELKAMTKSQKDPLAALYLSLCASGIVLATVGLLLIGNSEMEGLVILYTIAILLVLGGGAALIVTGYFRPAASHTHSLKRFAERNNFTLTSGPVSDSTVMNGLAVLFPERKTKIYFELKGSVYGASFSFASFELYGGRGVNTRDIIHGRAVLNGTYGLLALKPHAEVAPEVIGDLPVVDTVAIDDSTYIVVFDGIPKDRDGLMRLFNLIAATYRKS